MMRCSRMIEEIKLGWKFTAQYIISLSIWISFVQNMISQYIYYHIGFDCNKHWPCLDAK